MQEIKTELTEKFKAIFGSPTKSLSFFFAPGRINIIGDHIDYCGGKVLPAAIDRGTFAVITASDDKQFHCYSQNENSLVSFTSKDITPNYPKSWARYLMGLVKKLQLKTDLPPFKLYLTGNLPLESGLSSSASLLLVIAWALQDFSNFYYSSDDIKNRKQTALACQEIENNFIGLQCGIMDQATIALAQDKKAMLLDCAKLEFDLIDCKLGEDTLLIVNSNKPRQLTESKYNERKQETDNCLAILQKKIPLENLANIPKEQIDYALSLVNDSILKKRLLHQITENQLVLNAYQQLANQDNIGLGQSLQASHLSLRENYEVTGRELDLIFDYSMQCKYVKGIRMTGAGFTGCLLAIIAKR